MGDGRPRSNRAHALLFLKRTREARALYLAHKGKMAGGKPWPDAIAEDFARLRAAGLSHPTMARIERDLGVAARPKAKAAPRPRTGRRTR